MSVPDGWYRWQQERDAATWKWPKWDETLPPTPQPVPPDEVDEILKALADPEVPSVTEKVRLSYEAKMAEIEKIMAGLKLRTEERVAAHEAATGTKGWWKRSVRKGSR